jgi:hypothetical protein
MPHITSTPDDVDGGNLQNVRDEPCIEITDHLRRLRTQIYFVTII